MKVLSVLKQFEKVMIHCKFESINFTSVAMHSLSYHGEKNIYSTTLFIKKPLNEDSECLISDHTFYGMKMIFLRDIPSARGFGSVVKHSTADPEIASSTPPRSN